MTGKENRVTTREFYQALLEIKPQLQRIDDAISDLQRWARGEDGIDSQLKVIDDRIEAIELRHHAADTRHKTIKTLFGIFQAIVYAAIALVSALIGSNWH